MTLIALRLMPHCLKLARGSTSPTWSRYGIATSTELCVNSSCDGYGSVTEANASRGISDYCETLRSLLRPGQQNTLKYMQLSMDTTWVPNKSGAEFIKAYLPEHKFFTIFAPQTSDIYCPKLFEAISIYSVPTVAYGA